MKAEKQDRRVRYTTILLRESLVKLMQTTPISRISVKMLCEEADINRSTFYAHFEDQYDLLRKVEQEVVKDVRQYVNKYNLSEHSESTTLMLKQILEYVGNNAEVFKVLLSDNGDLDFQRDVMSIAQEKIISDIRNYEAIHPRMSEYLQCFVIGGALRLVQKWLVDGMVESALEMAELTSKLLYKGTSSVFQQGGT